MKITICGSMAKLNKMLELQKNLEKIGHAVKVPQIEIKNQEGELLTQKQYDSIRKTAKNEDRWVWDINREAMRDHFVKITWSDAILIPNYEKDDVPNYIGPNTLMEMGLALFLNKKIFLLNQIPDIPSKEEILGVDPVILDGDLSKIQ
ncbi:hypothetical protein ACFL1M_00105 [Patescibacteria group bacterium]